MTYSAPMELEDRACMSDAGRRSRTPSNRFSTQVSPHRHLEEPPGPVGRAYPSSAVPSSPVLTETAADTKHSAQAPSLSAEVQNIIQLTDLISGSALDSVSLEEMLRCAREKLLMLNGRGGCVHDPPSSSVPWMASTASSCLAADIVGTRVPYQSSNVSTCSSDDAHGKFVMKPDFTSKWSEATDTGSIIDQPGPKETLRSHLSSLQGVELDRIFVARNVHKLGFGSAEILDRHYSQYGKVSRVLAAPSKVSAVHGSHGRTRTRPGGLALVVMELAESTAWILSLGEEQHIAERAILVHSYKQKQPEAESAAADISAPQPKVDSIKAAAVTTIASSSSNPPTSSTNTLSTNKPKDSSSNSNSARTRSSESDSNAGDADQESGGSGSWP